MRIPGRDFLVYLAGPIGGLTFKEGQGWRDYVARELPMEIRAMSPLRGKGQLTSLRSGVIHANGYYEDNPLTAQAGITARDRNDCMRADAVLFNLLGATSVSIGTMVEIGWADAYRKPIVLVIEDPGNVNEPTGNVHEHPMIRAVSGFRVNNLDDAIAVLTAVLLPEGEGTPRMTEVEPIETIPTIEVNIDPDALVPRKQGKLIELGYRTIPEAG